MWMGGGGGVQTSAHGLLLVLRRQKFSASAAENITPQQAVDVSPAPQQAASR